MQVVEVQANAIAMRFRPTLSVRRVPNVRNTFAHGGEVRDLQFTRDTGSDDFEQSYKWSLAAMRVPKVKEMTELQVGFFANQFLSKTTSSQIRLYLDRHWARGD